MWNGVWRNCIPGGYTITIEIEVSVVIKNINTFWYADIIIKSSFYLQI